MQQKKRNDTKVKLTVVVDEETERILEDFKSMGTDPSDLISKALSDYKKRKTPKAKKNSSRVGA